MKGPSRQELAELSERAAARLESLLSRDGHGLFTSDGLLFNHTVFGRDVSIISRWLLEADYERYGPYVRDAILYIAKLQGTRKRAASEEEPGRILNQAKSYRDWRASPLLKASGLLVGLVWGGTTRYELHYANVDATPLFIRLVCAYAQHDSLIWEQTVRRKDGSIRTIRQIIGEATDWMLERRPAHRFVARPRANPFSLFHLNWRDSHLAYLYPDGSFPRLKGPMVYLEVQIAAVEALRTLAAARPRDPERDRWRRDADELARQTIERFWLPDHHYFASALDTGRDGHLRPIPTPASSGGWLLDSSLFDGLPAREVQTYTEAIVRRLGSSEFLTKAGIRTRGNGSDSGIGVASYHGSWAVWPMDNYMYARGLRRQGLTRLADDIEARIVRAVTRGGSFYEYFLVSPAGEVLWRPHDKPARTPVRHVNLQILPERDLGWTVALCVNLGCHTVASSVKPAAWREALQDEVLGHINHLPERPQADYPFSVRRVRGAVKVSYKAGGALVRQYLLGRDR